MGAREGALSWRVAKGGAITALMIRRALLVVTIFFALTPADALAQNRRRNRRQPGAGAAARPALPEPGQARTASATQLKTVVARSPRSDDVARALGDASTGALPASARSRTALATALSEALASRTLTPLQSERVAEALAIAGNADGLTSSAIATARATFTAALGQAGVPEAVKLKVALAFDQAVSEQQQENVQALAEDLQDLRAESAVTPAQVQALATSLRALCTGATRPSTESVQALAEDLSAALADGSIGPKEAAELAHDIEAVMQSANVSEAEAQAALDAARVVLAASNVDQADVDEIVTDLQAIRASMRPRSR